MILAIDPGPEQSAYIRWDGDKIHHAEIMANDRLLQNLRDLEVGPAIIAVEMIASYGMPVGKEVFETCLIIGRIQEIAALRGADCHLVYRSDVKMHLCQSMRAKDANIRQALIDRFGKPGTKKQPGLTYGLKEDLWSAFAIAVTVHDKQFPTPTTSFASSVGKKSNHKSANTSNAD